MEIKKLNKQIISYEYTKNIGSRTISRNEPENIQWFDYICSKYKL